MIIRVLEECFCWLHLCAVSVRGGVFAYDFTAVNSDGVTIYYNYINNYTEAEVTSEIIYSDYAFNNTSYSDVCIINIPETVTPVEGKTLKVTSIGEMAFYSRRSLTSVKIPNTVTSIGESAFKNCTSLTSVDIPNSVTSIGYAAFYECIELSNVVIPKAVTNIDNSAFYNCKMTSITIPDGMTTIKWNSFANCYKLTSLDIPNTITKIEGYAFSGCTGLTSVSIGNSVTNIDQCAFNRCNKLEAVTLRGNKLPTCGDNVFKDVGLTNATLYCNYELIGTCKNTAPWSSFTKIKVTPIITITDAGMATGCFDDDLDFTDVAGVKAYIVSGYSPTRGKALLTRATQIPAKTGFIVKGTKGTYEIPAATTDYTYANMLVGVLENTSLPATDDTYTNYVLSTGDGDDTAAGFYLPKGDDYVLAANKAYLRIPKTSTSEAKSIIGLSFDDEDDTTDISAIKELNDESNGDTTIYNLNGQRKQSLTKGLNIVNGKKIFIK